MKELWVSNGNNGKDQRRHSDEVISIGNHHLGIKLSTMAQLIPLIPEVIQRLGESGGN